jgi:shikimate dehydrogenase
MASSNGEPRRAAVVGRPVGHSLSPVLHTAGYAAAGLTGWAYTAVECAGPELPGLVAALGPEWAGLSVTMPCKEAALAVAGTASPLAAALGAANTLVRRPGGWHADNTDAPGMVDALRGAGVAGAERVAVLGAGGTARAAVGAAAVLGAAVTAYARRPAAAAAVLGPVADALGVPLAVAGWDACADAVRADVVVATVPKGAADGLDLPWRPGMALLDVVYDPWPTPLAAAAAAAGCRIVSGLDLLHAQAVHQFALFTGVPAPAAAMRAALAAARG